MQSIQATINTTTEKDRVYIVYTVARTVLGAVEVVPFEVYEEVGRAQQVARKLVAEMKAKGYETWAKKIRVKSPRTIEGYNKVATQLSDRGHFLDMWSGGRSFYAARLIELANSLRTKAADLSFYAEFSDNDCPYPEYDHNGMPVDY